MNCVHTVPQPQQGGSVHGYLGDLDFVVMIARAVSALYFRVYGDLHRPGLCANFSARGVNA